MDAVLEMEVQIYLKDLKDDKRQEIMMILGEDVDKYMDIPLVSIDFEEGAVF